jgi:hypothetical protein
MKKILLLVLLFLFTIIIIPCFESCNKYEDGPKISLRSRYKKIVKKWNLVKYIVNGSDNTQGYLAQYPDYTIEYRWNETYEVFTNDTSTYSYGTWSFLEDDSSNVFIERWPNDLLAGYFDHKILKFYKDELWETCNGVEFHFKAEK